MKISIAIIASAMLITSPALARNFDYKGDIVRSVAAYTQAHGSCKTYEDIGNIGCIEAARRLCTKMIGAQNWERIYAIPKVYDGNTGEITYACFITN
ncbi:MAG: hypothetical protein AAFO61_13685 [Pseudomonadota bacterium]